MHFIPKFWATKPIIIDSGRSADKFNLQSPKCTCNRCPFNDYTISYNSRSNGIGVKRIYYHIMIRTVRWLQYLQICRCYNEASILRGIMDIYVKLHILLTQPVANITVRKSDMLRVRYHFSPSRATIVTLCVIDFDRHQLNVNRASETRECEYRLLYQLIWVYMSSKK